MLMAAGTFTVGWWRLARRSPRSRSLLRLASALGGLVTIVLALTSPLDELAHAWFSWHMTQHVLLMMVAPALILLANPLPILLWALPWPARLAVGRTLVAGAAVRRVWRGLTSLPAAWLLSTLTLWLWHLPAAYEAALRSPRVHDLEHLMFFWSGLLLWWPIIGPAPRVRRRVAPSGRIGYTVLAGGQQALLGLLLMTRSQVLYPLYATLAPLAGAGALGDQRLGGLVMWGTSTILGLVTLMALIYRLLAEEEDSTGTAPFLTRV